jgi:hypothetical protein
VRFTCPSCKEEIFMTDKNVSHMKDEAAKVALIKQGKGLEFIGDHTDPGICPCCEQIAYYKCTSSRKIDPDGVEDCYVHNFTVTPEDVYSGPAWQNLNTLMIMRTMIYDTIHQELPNPFGPKS